MKTQTLAIAQIVTTAGTQIRAQLSDTTVDTYAEAMRGGALFPPIIVFHDGSQFVLSDGFHRLMAAARCGFASVDAEIHTGGRSDALRFALGANGAHGLPRTNADKRRSVELALSEWPNLSDRELARICAVSVQAVCNWRPQLSTVDSCEPPKRIGADGKERKLPARPDPEPKDDRQDHEAQPAAHQPRQVVGTVPQDDDEPEPEPPQESAADAFARACGQSSARLYFVGGIQDLGDAIRARSSDEQLSAALGQWQVEAVKLRQEQAKRAKAKLEAV